MAYSLVLTDFHSVHCSFDSMHSLEQEFALCSTRSQFWHIQTSQGMPSEAQLTLVWRDSHPEIVFGSVLLATPGTWGSALDLGLLPWFGSCFRNRCQFGGFLRVLFRGLLYGAGSGSLPFFLLLDSRNPTSSPSRSTSAKLQKTPSGLLQRRCQ